MTLSVLSGAQRIGSVSLTPGIGFAGPSPAKASIVPAASKGLADRNFRNCRRLRSSMVGIAVSFPLACCARLLDGRAMLPLGVTLYRALGRVQQTRVAVGVEAIAV